MYTVIKDAFNQLDPKKQGAIPAAKIAEGMQKCGINLRRDQLQQIMNDLDEEGKITPILITKRKWTYFLLDSYQRNVC